MSGSSDIFTALKPYDPDVFAAKLITELRLLPYVPGEAGQEAEGADAAFISRMEGDGSLRTEGNGISRTDRGGTSRIDGGLRSALTVNEELLAAGYTLRPGDLSRLSKSPSRDACMRVIREALPAVKAKPMYPDFPTQVMEMSEAEFRLHQLLHYFSTYGTETLTGRPVKRGWLPSMKETPKTEDDQVLLSAKLLDLIPENEAPMAALVRILSKRERMTNPEAVLVGQAVQRVSAEELAGLSIPFKENMRIVFLAILLCAGKEERVGMLRGLCQHTGDVLKCIDYLLPLSGFHFRTGQKRTLVRLLESYPVQDFRANLILSRKKGDRNKTVLRYLDYNLYSRSPAHREAVAALRDGKLRSWEARAKHLLAGGEDGALDFIAERPGMMLRMLGYLLSCGYEEAELQRILAERTDRLSMHTVVSVLNALDEKASNPPSEECLERAISAAELQAEREEGRLKPVLTENGIRAVYKGRREKQHKWRDRMLKGFLRALGNGRMSETQYAERCRWTEKEYERSVSEMDEREKKSLENVIWYPAAHEAVMKAAEKKKKRLRKQYASRVRSFGRIGAVRRILLSVLDVYFSEIRTELAGRSVYVDFGPYAPEFSRIEAGQKSQEGGYIPSGIAYRIPEKAKCVRLFVYWNDKKRVDVDLHAFGYRADGSLFHIGWNAAFNDAGVLQSGDITHSNAAEYVDIRLDGQARQVLADIHLYYGKPSFKEIETCFAGLMAVRKLGAEVKLYQPANCFFSHELTTPTRELHYACVDIPERLVYFTGKDMKRVMEKQLFAKESLPIPAGKPALSLESYVERLLAGQKAVRTEKPKRADIILTLDKSQDPRAVSLIERNFFLQERTDRAPRV